ncbi:MAG: tRNA 4-thiouridine(8) synthase ThiI [Lentisphaeria bacterium]|nr:tRNA 4-thiouridine(8) synthase ThiI [Lentisphaeria bacterium]
MYNAVICRYHEIAIKGNNRREFERQLIGNMHSMMRGKVECRIRQIRGRIWIEPAAGAAFFTAAEQQTLAGILSRCFGLESFSPARLVPPDMEEIKAAAAEVARPVFAAAQAEKTRVSFRIRARRSDKEFPFRSRDIEIALAEVVAKSVDADRLDVDLDDPDLSLGCEVREEFAALFLETFRGPGGLPVGCNGKVLVLLSGGIDSPVCAYRMMKRGCAVDFLTFHSSPYTPPESEEKVRELAACLNRYQFPGTLHLCNLAPLQKQIRDLCTERDRTVLYRRAMLRIAEKIATQCGAGALATGEAVGQVASQTLRNLATINAAVRILILRPLCGSDKSELIRMAEEIGTYPISIRKAPDSCTVFAPASPATSVPESVATAEEAKIPDYDRLLDEITAAAVTCRP